MRRLQGSIFKEKSGPNLNGEPARLLRQFPRVDKLIFSCASGDFVQEFGDGAPSLAFLALKLGFLSAPGICFHLQVGRGDGKAESSFPCHSSRGVDGTCRHPGVAELC
jgi:hypothetical protein